MLVPVGGGGLLAGTLAWVKQFHPETKVIGVEPAGAASMQAALAAGKPVTLPEVDTFADGTAVAHVGDITFEVAQNFADGIVSVPEGLLLPKCSIYTRLKGLLLSLPERFQ
ncbi:pyridoxal-phosphate dependent enzyme [Arcanobacterium hippocoleae]